MRKYMVAVMVVISTISSVMAQYGNQGYANNNDDRYYYDNDFDWHWDIRVRISDGIQRGLITQFESNRLYRHLEDLERKEYAYQSDGFYNSYEQQEVWNDVVYFNRQVGVELSDYDRNFYGFDDYGYDRRGYLRSYYQGGFDFFRFDKRGFGNIRLGYFPRPSYNGWFGNNRNQIARRYCTERSQYANSGYFQRGEDRSVNRGGYNNHPNRGNNDSNGAGYGNDRNSQGGNRIERLNNGTGYSQGNRPDQSNNGNNNRGYSQGNRQDQPNFGSDRNGGSSQGNRIDQPTPQPNIGSDRNVGSSQGNRQDRPVAQPNNSGDNNSRSGGNDWNMNRGGANRERPSGRKGND